MNEIVLEKYSKIDMNRLHEITDGSRSLLSSSPFLLATTQNANSSSSSYRNHPTSYHSHHHLIAYQQQQNKLQPPKQHQRGGLANHQINRNSSLETNGICVLRQNQFLVRS